MVIDVTRVWTRLVPFVGTLLLFCPTGSPLRAQEQAVKTPPAEKAQPAAPAETPPGSDADLTERDPVAAAKQEAELLTETRQLTFEGKRAGEGYFSQDGSQLVFQSEREPGNPFFQIYLMDLETGDVERISPGRGKTTCAWIHPSGKRVLFASTHDDQQAEVKQREELELREKGQERRYAWDYDEHFELYDYDRQSGEAKNLTGTRGYDAEASWSPDGKWIAFTSNRRAYSEELTEEEQKNFAIDPAYLNDIYLMAADGSGVTRLTTAPGYDGGPFFSPDGKRICWRRFTPDGSIAEVWTMNRDGSDQRQLTRLGAMSWAPFYHPSGEYLIFTTNRHGFANFELYLIDAAGQSAPVRVTYTKGFDGLPVFTPDGKQLAWTSNRTGSKQSQLFIAQWNHERARALLGLDQTGPVATAAEQAARGAALAAREQARSGFDPQDVVRHVGYLCHEQLEGRLTGTEGERLATAYVAAYLDSLGLQPAGDNGSWFQEFEFTSGVSLGADNQLRVTGVDSATGTQAEPALINRDWRPVTFSQLGPVAAAPVVFAGYGIVVPASEDQPEYDSYVHLDVKDKWVIVFRYMPENVSAERRQHLSRPSQLRFKTMLARDRGARGLIVVSGPNSKTKDPLVPLQSDGTLSGSSLPVISVTDQVVESWLAASGSGKTLKQLQDRLDQGELQMGFPLEKIELAASISIEQTKRRGRNVLGRLPASEFPDEPALMIGAHIDHLGRGGSSSSLARDQEREAIHFGADDNASGIAAMLEIAEYLVDQRERGKLPLRRDVIFAAWSGEELGLIGSNHYVKTLAANLAGPAHAHDPHAQPKPAAANLPGKPLPRTTEAPPAPTEPGKAASASNHKAAAGAKSASEEAKAPHNPKVAVQGETHSAAAKAGSSGNANPHAHAAGGHSDSLQPWIAAYLNMDMVGRLDKRLILQGVGSSSIWRGEIERRNAPLGLPITLQDDSYLPTDASSFFMRGVPILSAFTGTHSEYHTPRDTPDTLNYDGAAKVAQFMGMVARSLAISEKVPDYVPQAAPEQGQRRASLRAYLGTIPDYAEEIKGVKLGGVAKNGPADKAGLRAGDVIVELAGKKIENIYDYTFAIEALKIGQTIKITVQRGQQKITLEVTPGSRD